MVLRILPTHQATYSRNSPYPSGTIVVAIGSPSLGQPTYQLASSGTSATVGVDNTTLHHELIAAGTSFHDRRDGVVVINAGGAVWADFGASGVALSSASSGEDISVVVAPSSGIAPYDLAWSGTANSLNLSDSGSISGNLQSAGDVTLNAGVDVVDEVSGDDVSVSAGRNVLKSVWAAGDISQVLAGGDIDDSITAAGDIGTITAGTTFGGDIKGVIAADGNIGSVTADGSKAVDSTQVAAAGAAPQLTQAMIDAGDTTAPTLSMIAAPTAGTKGDIAATITAGGSIGNVTADGSIAQAISAATSLVRSGRWGISKVRLPRYRGMSKSIRGEQTKAPSAPPGRCCFKRMGMSRAR